MGDKGDVVGDFSLLVPSCHVVKLTPKSTSVVLLFGLLLFLV
jgi:hypothetical protein